MRACANCGVSLADDQRYCLECGTRQVQARSQFLERFTPAAVGPSMSATGPGMSAAPAPTGGRSANATALAGIGVLLLAMGVGVLIGRASGSSSTSSPQIISVGSPAAATGASGATTTGNAGSESSGAGTAAGSSGIPEDWPAGKSGYAVQLQTFSTSTAQASEVTAAKSSALGKGATGVGILLSSNFASLPADRYVVYSGDYSSEVQARQALTKLKSKFSSAAVIHVSGASGAGTANPSSSPSSPSHSNGSAAKTGASSTGKGSSSPSSPSSSGHNAEQKSLSLPNVVTTG
jgi:SPOR domain